jgi:hypothetical protein
VAPRLNLTHVASRLCYVDHVALKLGLNLGHVTPNLKILLLNLSLKVNPSIGEKHTTGGPT